MNYNGLYKDCKNYAAYLNAFDNACVECIKSNPKSANAFSAAGQKASREIADAIQAEHGLLYIGCIYLLATDEYEVLAVSETETYKFSFSFN